MKPTAEEKIEILVVEDSLTQAERLAFILEKNGYTASRAGNGRDALAYLDNHIPTMVISDIMMPEMDGFELSREIKNSERLKHLPVLLLTTLSEPEDVLKGLESGADNFMNKPYEEQVLLSRINYILLNQELRRNRASSEMSIEIIFRGKKQVITSNRIQILDLLLSSYETAILKNRELCDANSQIAESNKALQAEIAERKRVEASLRKRHNELAVLNRISTAISSTIDMERLFNELVTTIVDIDILPLERRCVLSLAKNGSLSLAYSIGQSKAFIGAHENIPFGTCLCGLAAQAGKVIISRDAAKDARHTLDDQEAVRHGHIAIPLKAAGRLVGVLSLYLKPDHEIVVDENLNSLLESIGNQIGIALENIRLYEEAKNTSLHDPLTGLANRRHLDIYFDKAFAGAKRGVELSVIMLDIDHFKKYNDTFGHAAGDEVLVAVSNAIRKQSREANLIARYGGEEFVILLTEAGLTIAAMVAERLRKTVEKEAGVTISLGVATVTPEVQTRQQLLECADNALYQAKRNGRNRVEIFRSADT